MNENKFDLGELNRLVKKDSSNRKPISEESEGDPDFVEITEGKSMPRIEFEEIRDQIHYVDEEISKLETDIDRALAEEERRRCKIKINRLLDEKKQLMDKIGRTQQMTDFRHPI